MSFEKNLHEIYKSQWGPHTERKINRLIQGMWDPKWKNILAFFQDEDVFDYSYIQSPSHALCVPEVVPNNEIGFYLYMPMEAPIFTCFYILEYFFNTFPFSGGDEMVVLE